jgi:hypothetical protein
LVEDFRKPATTISKAAQLNEFDVLQQGVYNLHPSSLAGEEMIVSNKEVAGE